MRTIALSTSSLDALGYIHGQSPQLRELTSPTWVCTQTIAPPAGNDDGTPESRDSLQLEELRCLMSRTTLELTNAIKYTRLPQLSNFSWSWDCSVTTRWTPLPVHGMNANTKIAEMQGMLKSHTLLEVLLSDHTALQKDRVVCGTCTENAHCLVDRRSQNSLWLASRGENVQNKRLVQIFNEHLASETHAQCMESVAVKLAEPNVGHEVGLGPNSPRYCDATADSHRYTCRQK